MELEKKYKIDSNFIGIFDNFFPDEICQKFINYFEYCKINKMTYERDDKHWRDDEAVSMMGLDSSVRKGVEEITIRYEIGPFIRLFYDQIYPLYQDRFPQLKDNGQTGIMDFKIQKTIPSQGYHIWHTENTTREYALRFLTWTYYLNDIEEGGETEFLYQSVRVKPKKNRFVLWPAGMTHVNRGNPPLKENKYILTGWVEWK